MRDAQAARAARLAVSRAWFAKQRARGHCWICQQAMADDDPRIAHAICHRLMARGLRVAAIRRDPPVLRESP